MNLLDVLRPLHDELDDLTSVSVACRRGRHDRCAELVQRAPLFALTFCHCRCARHHQLWAPAGDLARLAPGTNPAPELRPRPARHRAYPTRTRTMT